MVDSNALVIGGTGFVGRHTVVELLDHGYGVTALSRGSHGFRFPATMDVDHICGDRSNDETLADAAQRIEPDVVIDWAAYHPADVQTAIDIFTDVDAYIYVSSGGVYSSQEIPKREEETPLHDYMPVQGNDDSMKTYGPRKAECDRIVRAADGLAGVHERRNPAHVV